MNLYDVLRLVVSKASLPEAQANDCFAVLEEAERMNMLGTSVAKMEVQAHEHQYDFTSTVCRLCGEGRL